MTLRQALEVLERRAHRPAARARDLRGRLPRWTTTSCMCGVSPASLASGRGSDHALPPSPFGARRPAGGGRPGARRGERVFVLERLRLLGGHPIGYQTSFLPGALGEEATRADLGTTPLRQVLGFKLGVDIVGARETVSAVALDARVARELGCRPGVAKLPLGSRLARRRPAGPSCTTACSSPATGSASPARSPSIPGRTAPGRSFQARATNEDSRDDQAGARHRDPGQDRGPTRDHRHRRHHVDRLSLRRVRGGGGPPHQGEARPGPRSWPCPWARIARRRPCARVWPWGPTGRSTCATPPSTAPTPSAPPARWPR